MALSADPEWAPETYYPAMWRLYQLRRVLREHRLLEIGLAMLNGTYWQNDESYYGAFPVDGDGGF